MHEFSETDDPAVFDITLSPTAYINYEDAYRLLSSMETMTQKEILLQAILAVNEEALRAILLAPSEEQA